jgi:uncharacterized protein YvpB
MAILSLAELCQIMNKQNGIGIVQLNLQKRPEFNKEQRITYDTHGILIMKVDKQNNEKIILFCNFSTSSVPSIFTQ